MSQSDTRPCTCAQMTVATSWASASSKHPRCHALSNAIHQKLERRLRCSRLHDGSCLLKVQGLAHEKDAIITSILDTEAQVLFGGTGKPPARCGLRQGAHEVRIKDLETCIAHLGEKSFLSVVVPVDRRGRYAGPARHLPQREASESLFQVEIAGFGEQARLRFVTAKRHVNGVGHNRPAVVKPGWEGPYLP